MSLRGAWQDARRAQRILVIAPHADDEVIGCGGTIARATDAGADVTLIVLATGGIKHLHLEEAASTPDRQAELDSAARILGVARTRVLFPGRDMRLESVPMLEIVTALDGIIRDGDYTDCYIPEPSHNRDHQITHDAAIAALRPCGRRPHELVVAYEGTDVGLQAAPSSPGRLYVDISATLGRKIDALHAYRSQIRSFPHPVSEEALRRMAAMRGLECGIALAERFRVLRAVRF